MAGKVKCISKYIVRFCVFGVILLGLNSPAISLQSNGGYSAPYFQADYIQDISEFSAGIINPALLYRVNQMRLEFGGYRWDFGRNPEADDLGYQHASFLLPIRLNQTVGLSAIWVRNSIDEQRISDGGTAIESTGKILKYGDLWWVGHYAVRLRPWLMVGANPKMLIQNQFNQPWKLGFALDVGIYLNPFDHYRFGDLGFSLTLQDIVPATTQWVSGQKQAQTTRFRTGIRYAAFNDKLIGDAEMVIDNAFVDIWKNLMPYINDKDSADQTASKFAEKVGRYGVHLRYEFIPQVWIKGGLANNLMPYLGFNINVIYPLPEMINYARIDAHVGYSVSEPERGLSLMAKVATDFGYTREQKESRRLYNLLILAPMNAYLEAMRLYTAKRYWEAGFAFGKVVTLYPNFHLNDRATYYMGNCYRFQRMNDIAREVYKEGLSEYTTSEVRANYLYGLEDIDYKEGNYDNALKNHAFITNLYGEHEIRPDADYIAGQIHFLRKNYNAAEILLSGIKQQDSVYFYAQYTLAVVNIANNKSKAAIQNLNSIIADTSTDPGILLLQDAANNKLGQLYFEEVELRKAVEAFSQVPQGSPFGDEALMGIAWSWIKVNRPEEALKTINQLIISDNTSPLIPEAFLVKGYAQMLLKTNQDAKNSFEQAVQLCKNEFASDQDLVYRKEKFGQYLQQFAPSAQKIKKNALRKPTEKTEMERVELKTEFDKFAKESNDFFAFVLKVESNREFFRRKDQILSDAEYALAKVSKILGISGVQEYMKKQAEKADDIDSEIEKLKKQLEKEQGQ
jgi:tetratricopeptide (TPR) repeat protein